MSAKVYLIGRTHFDVEPFLSFLRRQSVAWERSTTAAQPEELVEAAGRICYMSFGANQSPKSNAEYLRHLIRMGHESVLEHVSWTVLLEGVSRAFTHQLVRHRAGFAFSQLSQQYHDEGDAQFVEPAHLRDFPAAQAAWQQSVQASGHAYREIQKALRGADQVLGLAGQRRETQRAIRSIARSVLPNATETKIVVTANARAWRHFFRVRGAIAGDAEMREAAAAIFQLLEREAPALFYDFRLGKLADGSPSVNHEGEGAGTHESAS